MSYKLSIVATLTLSVVSLVNAMEKTAMLEATKQGNTKEVQRLIEREPLLVDVIDENDTTPLHWAAGKGYEDIVLLLLNHNAPVNVATTHGDTPLLCAVRSNFHPIACILLDRGAEVNVHGRYGATPLHWAASKGNTETTHLLVEHGACVNAKAGNDTPLHWAVRNGHRDVVIALMDYKANSRSIDRHGRSSRDLAARHCTDAVNAFCEWPRHECTARNAQLALCLAQHPRLTSASPLNQLSPDIIASVARFIRPSHYIQQPAPAMPVAAPAAVAPQPAATNLYNLLNNDNIQFVAAMATVIGLGIFGILHQ